MRWRAIQPGIPPARCVCGRRGRVESVRSGVHAGAECRGSRIPGPLPPNFEPDRRGRLALARARPWERHLIHARHPQLHRNDTRGLDRLATRRPRIVCTAFVIGMAGTGLRLYAAQRVTKGLLPRFAGLTFHPGPGHARSALAHRGRAGPAGSMGARTGTVCRRDKPQAVRTQNLLSPWTLWPRTRTSRGACSSSMSCMRGWL